MNKSDIINQINNFDTACRFTGFIFASLFIYFFTCLCVYIINNKELNRKYVLSGTFVTLFLLLVNYIIITMIMFANDLLKYIEHNTIK